MRANKTLAALGATFLSLAFTASVVAEDLVDDLLNDDPKPPKKAEIAKPVEPNNSAPVAKQAEPAPAEPAKPAVAKPDVKPEPAKPVAPEAKPAPAPAKPAEPAIDDLDPLDDAPAAKPEVKSA